MKLATTETGYEFLLKKLLQAIDAAPLGDSNSFFKKLDDKEFYETQIMFAVRKRHTAKYHCENVARLHAASKKSGQSQLKAAAMNADLKIGSLKSTATVTKYTGAYGNELVAFLTALRSGLDFLTVAACRSIPGVKAHSVKTLMNMADKESVDPVIAVVKAHIGWLKSLRGYRDEVIHRLVIQAPADGWKLSQKGKPSVSVLPVVVPKATPNLTYDTRRSRMMETELPSGLMEIEKSALITYPDGTEEVIDHSVAYSPTPGYLPIEEFMQKHLTSYDLFLEEMLKVLATFDFA